MRTLIVSMMLFVFFATRLPAQDVKVSLDEKDKLGGATKSEVIYTPCYGEINTPGKDLLWRPILTTKIQSFEPEAPDAKLTEQMKDEKTRLKLSNQWKGQMGENSVLSETPMVGINYLGNENNGSSPLDNSIAVSNGGWIVSVANTTIEFDNSSGSTVYYNDLVSFINNAAITGVCDPVVIYDPGSDRFIFFCQTSPITVNSKLVICFSKTNNPNDGWYTYVITGNPLNNGTGFDYPKLAISTNELYISGNLFSMPAGTFNQCVFYQINKSSGYSGGTLSWQYWYNFSGSPFTLLPVSQGQGSSYGPGCYMVATASGGSSSIKLYDLTDDMSGSPTINYYEVNTTAYAPGGNAEQMGTSCLLDIGDCRSLSGFYLNGNIHFVFCSDIGSGWNGINYNRLNVSNKTNQSLTFGNVGSFDYCYPSVASFANVASDKSVMINFGRASSGIYPEVRVVNCDNNGNWSASTLVKSSSSYVSYTSSSKERWGDYTGISRKHNAAAPSVWMCGSFGTFDNKWSAWNAEIHGSGSGIGDVKNTSAMHIYPNPVIETFRLVFTLAEPSELGIQIVDANGNLVKELYSGITLAGEKNFSFNKANLAAGVYFLVVKSNSKIIKNEKIIVAN